MRILIIRHGDPDYAVDSLTEKGWREAELLKERLLRTDLTAIYCSPLGRARDTARPTLETLGRTAEICDWLREFDGYVLDPVTGERTHPWDRLPAFLDRDDAYFDKNRWLDTAFYRSGDVPEKFGAVCRGIDAVLAAHGYVHEGHVFRVERENADTLAFFCHFGVECVLLSHLLNMPTVALWHGTVALPSSVTTLYTEEREQGIASLRCCGFGDLSHLYAGEEPASFQARFCERFSDDTRH